MSGNIDDRNSTTGKMFPMDLAPQKITIVKSVPNPDLKPPHLGLVQPKSSTSTPIITHTLPLSLMRPSGQMISQGISTQPQMIVSGAPLLQNSQIVNQNSQSLGQGGQPLLVTSSQIVNPQTHILSQGTQLSASSSQPQMTSQGTQISISQMPSVTGGQMLVSASGAMVMSAGPAPGTLRTLAPSVRVLAPLNAHQNTTRPAISSSAGASVCSLTVSKVSAGSHVPRGPAAGASLAVPRAAPRLPTPVHGGMTASSTLGSWSSAGRMGAGVSVSAVGAGALRGHTALVYTPRAPAPRTPLVAPSRPNTPTSTITPNIPTLATTVRGSTASVFVSRASPLAPRAALTPPPSVRPSITSVPLTPNIATLTGRAVRPGTASSPHRAQMPLQSPALGTSQARTLSLVQRNYQPTKVVGVATLGVRTVASLSPARSPAPSAPLPAPPTLYYEVTPRTHTPHLQAPPRLVSPFTQHNQGSGVSVSTCEASTIVTSVTSTQPVTPVRPSILRKRDLEGSPIKSAPSAMDRLPVFPPVTVLASSYSSPSVAMETSPYIATEPAGGASPRSECGSEAEGGGSTTVSAASSPAPDEDMPSPPSHPHNTHTLHTTLNTLNTNTTLTPCSTQPQQTLSEISPRKKPRKQMLTSEVREFEFPTEELSHKRRSLSPPSRHIAAPIPKRPTLATSYRCHWRATAMHFTRPGDVRRGEARPADVVELANQPRALCKANGWKVHHLAAQMDDLTEMENGVMEKLSSVLRQMESSRLPHTHHTPVHMHPLIELVKGNMQRSRVVCESVGEARADILKIFEHQAFVTDILTRQADKRCFRKHRTQS